MKLNYESFGNALLATEDLDPVYVLLVNSGSSMPFLKRFCLAYWCFYHSGVAAKIAEVPHHFWGLMETAIEEKWPRGVERRHFRGKACGNALDYMQRLGVKPEKVVDMMTEGDTCAEVMKSAMVFPAFGPWIGFKIADMKERVLAQPCKFETGFLDIFKDPAIGAALVRKDAYNANLTNANALPPREVNEVVVELCKLFRRKKAPPTHDRRVGPQEVETILCKWKSHLRNHYPVGKDTREIAEQLKHTDFGRSLKKRLMGGLPFERLNRWERSFR